MDFTPGALGTHQQPSVRRHVLFLEKLKKIVAEVFGSLIILLHGMSFRMLLETTFKKIERRVISAVKNIFDVLFHGNFEFAARVTFSDFESAVAES